MSDVDRVMLDIETLGTNPGCVVLSIGAVRFNQTDGLGEEFYENIDITSCTDEGLTIDGDTLDWWLAQDEAVQGVLTGGSRLSDALLLFNEYYADADEVWAFSPSFDCSVLEAAYDAVGLDVPWGYRDERDCRTLMAVSGVDRGEQDGDAHDALDDARYQAREAVRVLEWIQREDP